MSEEDRVTPIGLFHYAHSYASSALALRQNPVKATHDDAPIRFLYTHAIELYLKSYLRLNGVTANKLRSRALGHNMTALREKAKSFGLSLDSDQENQIDVLNNAILDRYIVVGNRKVLSFEELHNLCFHLHKELGTPVYEAAHVKRKPIPFK